MRQSKPMGQECRGQERRGAAVIELAVLLPLLIFLFFIGMDFARVFYYSVTLNSCARNGAIYGSKDELHALDENGIKNMVLADAVNLTPAPEVSSSTGTDSEGNPCVNVTVSWTFNTVTRFPGVPNAMVLTRTVQMRIAPMAPKDLDAPG